MTKIEIQNRNAGNHSLEDLCEIEVDNQGYQDQNRNFH